MRFRKLAIIVSAGFSAFLSVPTLAQQIDKERLQDVTRQVIDRAGVPQITERVRRASYDSGARYWISPMLRNAPGTIGGEQYTIDRKRLTRNFELSVINPSGDHGVSAVVGCYDASGAYLTRYQNTFSVPPLGAVNWNSSSVTPPSTTDGASEDVDDIWCVVGGDRPVVVFGWTVRQFGGEVSRHHFSLERADASER